MSNPIKEAINVLRLHVHGGTKYLLHDRTKKALEGLEKHQQYPRSQGERTFETAVEGDCFTLINGEFRHLYLTPECVVLLLKENEKLKNKLTKEPKTKEMDQWELDAHYPAGEAGDY